MRQHSTLGLVLGCLLVSTALAVPVQDKEKKVTKRDTNDLDDDEEDMSLDSYRGRIIPGMVDDQVAAAFLKDAADSESRTGRRQSGEEEEEEGGEGPLEVPLALPMSRLADQAELEYAEERPPQHRSKALQEDIYPADEGDAYLPYYPTGEVYYRRRRRSGAAPRAFRKRSQYTPVRDLIRPKRARSPRRKRQIRLSDRDLGALIAFLSDLKVSMEKSSRDCNNPAHHSFFRENELNEELGAGSGIDDDYADEEGPAPDQELPVWLVPHAYQPEVLPLPQRRAFYYPTMLPGQKRAVPGGYPGIKHLESKLRGLSSPGDLPPRRYFH